MFAELNKSHCGWTGRGRLRQEDAKQRGNFQIIQALQTTVEFRLFSVCGVCMLDDFKGVILFDLYMNHFACNVEMVCRWARMGAERFIRRLLQKAMWEMVVA